MLQGTCGGQRTVLGVSPHLPCLRQGLFRDSPVSASHIAITMLDYKHILLQAHSTMFSFLIGVTGETPYIRAKNGPVGGGKTAFMVASVVTPYAYDTEGYLLSQV